MLGDHVMNMMVFARCSLEQVTERLSACLPPKQKKDRPKEYEEYRTEVAHWLIPDSQLTRLARRTAQQFAFI